MNQAQFDEKRKMHERSKSSAESEQGTEQASRRKKTGDLDTAMFFAQSEEHLSEQD